MIEQRLRHPPRFYVNRLGRFLTIDPARSSARNPQSFNAYSYAGSEPINRSDPTGAYACVCPSWGLEINCGCFCSDPMGGFGGCPPGEGGCEDGGDCGGEPIQEPPPPPQPDPCDVTVSVKFTGQRSFDCAGGPNKSHGPFDGEVEVLSAEGTPPPTDNGHATAQQTAFGGVDVQNFLGITDDPFTHTFTYSFRGRPTEQFGIKFHFEWLCHRKEKHVDGEVSFGCGAA